MDLLKLFKSGPDDDTYEAGAMIFANGDPASKMYVILEGEVEIRSASSVLERAGPGGVIGEMALIGDHRRTASAFAATDCRLAPINERRFLFLVQETPFFALHIMRVLAERILRKESRAS